MAATLDGGETAPSRPTPGPLAPMHRLVVVPTAPPARPPAPTVPPGARPPPARLAAAPIRRAARVAAWP